MVNEEIAIVGNGLSSLICGNILAQKGMKVTIYAESEDVGGFLGEYSKNGFSFSISPFLVTGFQGGGTITKLLRSFNIRLQASPKEILYQVILPNGRISAYADWDSFFLELKREFPSGIEDILMFYKKLFEIEKVFYPISQTESVIPATSISEKYSLRKEISPALNEIKPHLKESMRDFFPKRLKNSDFEKFMEVHALFFSKSRFENSSVLFFSYLCSMMRQGSYEVDSGHAHVIERLKKSFAKYGGVIQNKTRVSKVVIEKGKATGIILEENKRISCRNVVAEASNKVLYQKLIADEKYKKKIKNTGNSSGLPPLVPFALFIGMKEDVIPESMASDAFIVGNTEKTLMASNAMYVHMSKRGDTSKAPQGCRAVSVFCLTPGKLWQNRNRIEGIINKLKNVLLANLRNVIIFQEEGTEFVDIWSPYDFEERVTTPLGEVGENPPTVENFFLESQGNITPIKNLYHIGEGTYPSNWPESAATSGRNAAKLILKNKS